MKQDPMITIAAWPRKGVPYTELFYKALEETGVVVREGDFSIAWLLREMAGIDYFHFHWPSFFYGYRSNAGKTLWYLTRFMLFLLIFRIRGKKLIWTAHNLYPHESGGRLIVLIDVFVRHVVTRIASVILAHGCTAARIVAEEFPRARGKILVIDHGHFIDYYKNECSKTTARERLGLPDSKYVYLFVGMCRRYKNIVSLVREFKKIRGDSILVIAGEFRDEDYSREVLEAVRDAEDKIRVFDGYIPDDEMQLYLKSCDVVVLPYTEILTSGAAMLAISFGRPVLAPREGYLKDMIVDKCGLSFDPQDQNALRKGLSDIQGRVFDEETIIKYAKTYDWTRIADLTYSRLSKCITLGK